MPDIHQDSSSVPQGQVDHIGLNNEQLKNQLMTTSLIDDLMKVLQTIKNINKYYERLLLGIYEIVGFDRILFFDINRHDFTLCPRLWKGIDNFQKSDFTITLGFEGGEITDAIFLNRHLIVENIAADHDQFSTGLGSRSYIAIPLGSGTTLEHDETAAGRQVSGQHASAADAAADIETTAPLEFMTENERRKQTIESAYFKTQGVFWMDRINRGTPITSDDITALSLIITQSSIILENIHMYNALERANQELRDAQDKINKDLEHAQTIQLGLLPRNLPELPALTIKATYIPATAVGGDYYDAFEIVPGVFGIIVADVSGHGVASALIMSMVKVLLKTFANVNDGPKKTLEKINTIFQTEIETSNFVTVFYGMLDTNGHKLYYTSAGHCPILFFNKKEKTHTLIKADGLFLGIFPDMMLKESCVTYQPGIQRIVLYTDGLTEARNAKNEMFELARLKKAALKTLDDPPEAACKKILSIQKRFCGKNSEPDDDITLLVADF